MADLLFLLPVCGGLPLAGGRRSAGDVVPTGAGDVTQCVCAAGTFTDSADAGCRARL